MRLLYVVHQFFPECHSGTEQYCLAAAREARRRGDEVVILSLEPIYDRADPPLCVLERPYDGFRVPRLRYWDAIAPNDVLRDYENPLVAARFRAFLAEHAPDAVHFFHLRNLGADLLEVATDLGVRSVVSLMDFWYVCPRFTLLRRDGELCEGPPDGGLGCLPCAYPGLERIAADRTVAEATLAFARATDDVAGNGSAARAHALLRRPRVMLERLGLASGVVAPSRFLARMFARNGFPEARMRVVPYGLEPGRVRRVAVERPRTPLRVAFAGVLSPWKAPHVAVDAVLGSDLRVELTVHGRTEEGMFQGYIDALRARAAGDPRIRFAGAFGHGELDRVMADADVLVVPSLWYENTPFVVLEAFEAGVPVIASDLGGLSEAVRDGVNGFLFRAGSTDALAAVLRRCIDEPERLRALRPEAPPSIAASYDVFAELYRG